MVASVQNRNRQYLPTIRASVMIVELGLYFKNVFFKSLNSSKSENFRSIGFVF